jgi:hypothetical protein
MQVSAAIFGCLALSEHQKSRLCISWMVRSLIRKKMKGKAESVVEDINFDRIK